MSMPVTWKFRASCPSRSPPPHPRSNTGPRSQALDQVRRASGYSRGSLQCLHATLAPARFPEVVGGSDDLTARIASHQPCAGMDGGGRPARDTGRDGPDWLAERAAIRLVRL